MAGGRADSGCEREDAEPGGQRTGTEDDEGVVEDAPLRGLGVGDVKTGPLDNGSPQHRLAGAQERIRSDPWGGWNGPTIPCTK